MDQRLFVAVQETPPMEEFVRRLSPELVEEEKHYLAARQKEGRIFLAGVYTDGLGGLLIWKASSLEEAEQLVAQQPVVREGFLKVTLRELRPVDYTVSR